MKYTRTLITLFLLALLAACSAPEKPPYSGLKIGQPYEVSGHWYEPQYESHYDEIGMASWYGPGFHGGRTANGERYNQSDMTAAHRTLPMPSIVRVTNLDNGKSVLVRINDRGPFARSRIIDLSKSAALKLDIVRSGTAKVRVQYLDKETKEYVQNLPGGKEFAMRSLQEGEKKYTAGGGTAQEVPFTANNAPQPLPMNTQHADPLPPHVAVSNEPAPPIQTMNEPSETRSHYLMAPTPRQITGEGRGFFVQAGTFGLEENAHNLLNKVSRLGTSHVTEIILHEKRLFRVMIGPYVAQADARNVLRRLAEIGIPDARIIAE